MSAARVLIIEDDIDSRILYGECLRMEGFEVIESADGEEALDLLEKVDTPDLILTDLSMPRLSSEEFMRKLRADPKTREIPVVVLSGWEDIEERAEKIGAQDYLRKPCDLEPLIKTVRRHVETHPH